MTYYLGRGSLRHLERVHPELVWICKHAIITTQQDFAVVDGVRTWKEQAENVKTGVSKTMDSKHLIQADGYGHAVDLVPWINGRARWEINACYEIMNAVRKASFEVECLLRWGGSWNKLYQYDVLPSGKQMVNAYVQRKGLVGKPAFIDGPHYEIVSS